MTNTDNSSGGATVPPLLEVRDLRVSYRTRGAATEVVHGVSFDVHPGEIVALVGESGSGKSTVAQTLIGMLAGNGTMSAEALSFSGQDVRALSERTWRRIRGKQIGWVPQDPMSSLNPVMKIGKQVAETLVIHGSHSRHDAEAEAVELIERAGLSDAAARARQYPHQLSGGMRQRVLIAMATACRPQLLIADEPTSALDVTVQRQILDQLTVRVQDEGMAMLLVTHDLAVAADRADRVLVMSEGRIVEHGAARDVLSDPQASYTRKLLAAIPGQRQLAAARPRTENVQDAAPPLLDVRGIRKEFVLPGGGHRTVTAVADASVTLERGETLGIVGESGSGKSTLARIILRLEKEDRGSIHLQGEDVTAYRGERLRLLRQHMQVVYQNPFTSLSPRMTISDIVSEPLRAFGLGDKAERARRAAGIIDRVALPASALNRRPRELSGGQRQRVAIARALVLEPALLVCDEPTSALDVSVQAQILSLLTELQADLGVGILFISHDLAVVRDIAHRVMVMRHGDIVETGTTAAVFTSPSTAYTQELIASIPHAISEARTAHHNDPQGAARP